MDRFKKKVPPKQRSYLDAGKQEQSSQLTRFTCFPSLPLDLIPGQILRFLPLKGIACFSRTSKQSYKLAKDDVMWKALFFRDFSMRSLAQSFGSRKLQLSQVNRFCSPWKDYYYFMCSKSYNPDLSWENIRTLPKDKREEHVQGILALQDPRFHLVKFEAKVDEVVALHDFANPWQPKIHIDCQLTDGTLVKVARPVGANQPTLERWFHHINGDTLEVTGTLQATKPLSVALDRDDPRTVRETLSPFDIKWSGWLFLLLWFLFPLIYKASNLIFPKTELFDPNNYQYISGSDPNITRSLLSPPLKSQEAAIQYTNLFVDLIKANEYLVWLYISLRAIHINYRKLNLGQMPRLFLAFPPLPWPFVWVTYLNQFICAQAFIFCYSIGTVLPFLMRGCFSNNVSRFLLLTFLLAMSLRFRVRKPEPVGVALLVFVGGVLLLNSHYWLLDWKFWKNIVLFGLGVLCVIFLDRKLDYNYRYTPFTYTGLGIMALSFLYLAWQCGTFGVLWAGIKWIIYLLPVVFVLPPLVLTHDLHLLY